LFDGNRFSMRPDRLIRATAIDGIDLLPANQTLAPFNIPSPEELGMEQYALHEFLASGVEADLVLIDCPPTLYACSWLAMIAADFVVIPVPPEDFGTQGIIVVHRSIEQVRKLNPGLRRLGHLIARMDRRLSIHRAYDEKLRERYRDLVLKTVMPEAAAFKLALAARTPVEQFDPRSAAAEAMRNLAEEICLRIEARAPLRQVIEQSREWRCRERAEDVAAQHQRDDADQHDDLNGDGSGAAADLAMSAGVG
ncbi:MAG: ParA family protein, partial [Phycisphaerae bacterium]